MKFFPTYATIVVLFLVSAVGFAAGAEYEIQEVHLDVIVHPDPWTEGPGPSAPDLAFETHDREFCCDDGVYGFPDATCDGVPFDADGVNELEINTFHVDTITAEDCADWRVTMTSGIRPGANPLVLIDEEFEFGDLCAFVDIPVVLCIGYTVTPPDLTFDPPAGVPYSFGVETPTGSLSVPAVIENLSIE